MKICFFLPTLGSGGAERTVTYLSDRFANEGHDVSVLTLFGNVFYNLNPNVKVICINVNTGYKNLIERLLNIVKRFYRSQKYLASNIPDVVFCILPETAKYISGFAKRKKIRIITSERNNPSLDGNLKLKSKIFKKSDGVVFQTERAKLWYSTDIQKKSIVIHNAVGNDLVYKIPQITDRKKKIAAVGRLSSQKDYPTLFRAFRHVLDVYPNYTLELFGEGPEKENLIRYADDLGILENVKFMGVHKDAILKIADSACYVLSSLYEGMPNALMEAMAVGLPCISTDCHNGPAELIENEKNGILVPVGDSDALSKAILRMIEDREFAQSCGTEAKKILETHNVDVISGQYLDFVMSVLSRENIK